MLTERSVYNTMNKKQLKDIEKLIGSLDTAIRFNVPLFGESLISIRDILQNVIKQYEVDNGTSE